MNPRLDFVGVGFQPEEVGMVGVGAGGGGEGELSP